MPTTHTIRALLGTCFVSFGLNCHADTQQASPEPSTFELKAKLEASTKTLESQINNKGDPEPALSATYSDLQALCTRSFDDLTRDQERYATSEARTNIIGNFITLLSVVTVYPAGKTILAGIGMSSGSPGSISSSATQFFSNKAAADKTTLQRLKNELDRALDRYDAIDPKNDLTGTRRNNILSRAKGICLGLTPETTANDAAAQKGG